MTDPKLENRVKPNSKKMAAATAMAAAFYATTGAAQADIIGNDNGFVLTGQGNPSQSIQWDVDGDGTSDFRPGIADANPPFGYSMYFADTANIANGFVNQVGDGVSFFRNLATGLTVGPTLPSGYSFDGPTNSFQFRNISISGITVNAIGFDNGQNGFIGFRFLIAGQMHYGWAEVNFTLENTENHRLEVVRWAYNDEAGGSVNVGIIPEPASSGLLAFACGMAGVMRWRRKK